MIENMKRGKRTTEVDRGVGGGRLKLEWNWSGEGGGRRKSGGKSKRWLNRETGETRERRDRSYLREVGCSTAGLAFQADLVNRVHYFLVISFYNSSLLS